MKHTLLLLFLFQITFSNAQQKATDSLINLYSKCKIDTQRIDLSLSICNNYRDISPNKSIRFGKSAIKIAENIVDNKRLTLLYDIVGQCYDQIGDISNAIYYFNESFRIAYSIHDSKALARIKLNLGACYTDIGNYPLAIEYCKIAIEYFEKNKDNLGVCRSEIYTSDALYKSGNADDAFYYLERAKRISLKSNHYLMHYIYTNTAEAFYLKKEFALAIENVSKSQIISDSLNDLYAAAANYLLLSKVYLSLNDPKKAKLNVLKGLEIAKSSNIRESLVEAYNIYSNVLEKERNYADAFKYKCLFMTANDSDQSASNNNIIQTFENERSSHYLAMIKAKEKQKEAELKRQNLVIAVTLGTLFVLFGIMILIFYSRNRLKTANLNVELAYKELIVSNEQIRQQSKHIEELNNQKDKLFAIIAHDLRGPLKNLKSILNLLDADKLSKEKFQAALPLLIRGVSHTIDLVENLLYWSKSQLKGTTISGSNFDIHELIQNQIELFEKQANDKQIVITNEAPSNTFAFADKSMIDLVLRNLVANAIKFCYPEGIIAITAKRIPNYIEISVCDEGVGIEAENIDKIFQSKERFTTLGTNKEIGTGLGLLLCKEFIERNNGQIGVESKSGKGSKFWFTLPIAELP